MDEGWRRSSRCTPQACVEVLLTGDRVLVRDSKQIHQDDRTYINVSHSTWRTFLNELLGIEPIGANGILTTKSLDDNWIAIVDTSTGTSLSYDSQEWIAFIEGVELGELAPPLPA